VFVLVVEGFVVGAAEPIVPGAEFVVAVAVIVGFVASAVVVVVIIVVVVEA
jgi:hypothetical protein